MSQEKVIFEGSLMDGVNEDLPTWCGLSLIDEDDEKIWEETNPIDLLIPTNDIIKRLYPY